MTGREVIAVYISRWCVTTGTGKVLNTSAVVAGGRVTGKEVIAELVVELRASVQAAEQFEGEMRNLAAYAKALAQAIDCIRAAGGNR